MKKTIAIIGAAVIIMIIVIMLLHNKKTLDERKAIPNRSNIAVSVSVITVKQQEVQGDLTVPATLTAYNQADIPASGSGRIVSLNIELGSHVAKGQRIGRLDTRELDIKLAEAQLSAAKLERDYERNKILLAGNATNANAVKDSKYELDSKLLDIQQLKKQIADADIIAPISGIITDKKLLPGQYISTGAAVAGMVNTYTLKGRVYVPEQSVFRLKTGQHTRITSDIYPGKTFSGTITYVSPQGDENHNYLVEFSVDNHGEPLKAGQYVTVGFDTGNFSALSVPKVALVDGIKNPYVYVAEHGTAVTRKLTLGRELGENIEVIKGLSEGEQVITDGQINLVNGSKIETVTKK